MASGKLEPVLEVKISPEVSGEIIELPVKEGQKVTKGDLLLKIKPDMYLAAVNSSQANESSALANKSASEANLAKAKAEYVRAKGLFESKLISDSDYLTADTAYAVAKAQLDGAIHQVEMATAALQKDREDLSKTTIYSPLTGTVSRLNSRLGERVVGTAMMAGTEVMSVAELRDMEALVDIGEIDVVLLAIGQHARIEVDAYKDRKFNGIVTDIANSAKGAGTAAASSGSSGQEATKFEVKIRMQEKETFRPGMSVTAEIETRSRTNTLTVPIASVTTRLPKTPPKNKAGGTNSVASTNSASATNATAQASGETAHAKNPENKKANDAPKPIEVVFVTEGDHVKMLPVKLGISDDSYWEITDGVKEGQEVVSGGYRAISRELEDGKKVKIGPGKGEAGKDENGPNRGSK